MIEFLSTEEFSIYKNKDNNTFFSIELQKNSEPLINSIIKTKLLLITDVNDGYDSFSFRASSVKSFKKFISKRENISYENALKIIVNLTNQLQYLITKERLCFYEYIIENIIVIDNEKFIYLSNEDLLELSETNNIKFIIPFNRDGLISPEILKINSIPAQLNFKTIYYSLGALVVYFLFNKNINNDEDKNMLNEIIKPIEGTKLFGLITRCLTEESNNRYIIYI